MPERLIVWRPASSRIAGGSGIAFSVGGWFAAVTFTVNVRENVSVPPPLSVTVTVMIADPFTSPTGVKLSDPVVFGLVYVTVGFGINLVLFDEAVTVRV